MILVNKPEKSRWMNERIKKEYNFIFEKDWVNGEYLNVKIICVETKETFDMKWEQIEIEHDIN